MRKDPYGPECLIGVDRTAEFIAPIAYPRDGRKRRAKSWRRRWPAKIFALLAGGLLVAAIAAGRRGEDSAKASPSNPISLADFAADPQLQPLLSFRQVEDARAKVRYEARARPDSGERWDILTIGDGAADRNLFQVSLRLVDPAAPRPSLFVGLARQAAELGAAIVHATSARPLTTRRGAGEWAEITLSGTDGERACLGFHLSGSDAIDLSGLACGTQGDRLDEAALGRLIDRLSPTSPGVEAGLGEVLKSGAS